MLGCTDASQVLKGIDECHAVHLDCDMRLAASGWTGLGRVVAFIDD